MPASIVAEPLGLACVFSDGSTARFDLDGLPCAALTADLLAGLVELIHPHGAVDSAWTVHHYLAAVRSMVRTLAAGGFDGGVAELGRGRLVEFWMGTNAAYESLTRRMLQALASTRQLQDVEVVELVAGRAFNLNAYRASLPPYSEAEWERLSGVCRSIVDDAYREHRDALAAAARGCDPKVGGFSPENLSWLLLRAGPLSTVGVGQHLGCSEHVVRNRGGILKQAAALFPICDVVIAYRLLFGVYSGIVADGIDDLTLDDIDWAGDATILLAYIKGRTAAESVALPREAVRLLEQWLSHSALLRSHTDPHTRGGLWVRTSRPAQTATIAPIRRNTVQRWIQRHRLTGDDGGPLKVHQQRIRTTHLAMRDRRMWTGASRATIDPNHSPQVEGDHYLTATTAAQRDAVDTIIVDAQQELLGRARPPVVLDGDELVVAAADLPEVLAQLAGPAGEPLGGAVLAELIGGQRDVFVAGCADQLSGLHGPKGRPCPARPWVCLACPLAVFAPRHVTNLLRLQDFFTRQGQQMTTPHFVAVFSPYVQRLEQILGRFDPAVLAAAAASGAAEACDPLPLRPEEAT